MLLLLELPSRLSQLPAVDRCTTNLPTFLSQTQLFDRPDSPPPLDDDDDDSSDSSAFHTQSAMGSMFAQSGSGTLFLGGQKISGADIRDQNGKSPLPLSTSQLRIPPPRSSVRNGIKFWSLTHDDFV